MVALAKRQQVNGIQQIGFALSVLAEKAVELGRKLHGGFAYVLEIQYGYPMQVHA